LNKSYVVDADGKRLGRLVCRLNAGDAIGHAFLWILLTLVTLGLAMFVYQFRVARYVYNNTDIEWLEETAFA